MKALLIGLILNFSVQAQDSIDFGMCQVLKIDSIDYCNSHYSISFVTTIDTFTTVIEKEIVKSPIVSLIGKTVNISGESMNTLVLNQKDRFVTIGLVHSWESHSDVHTYNDIHYSWKTKKNFWKKEFVSITLTELPLGNKKTNVRITKLEEINY